ncbi:hypothetical protein PINS_up009145 [Pythium insidiosum]|nr:hypothetical protein PINS_up009145 [Pythium insidiosum]
MLVRMNATARGVSPMPRKKDPIAVIPDDSTMEDAIAVSGSDTETDDDTEDLNHIAWEWGDLRPETPPVSESADLAIAPRETDMEACNEPPTASLCTPQSRSDDIASSTSACVMSGTEPTATQASSQKPSTATLSPQPTKPAISVSSLAMRPIELLKTDGSYLSALFGAPPVEPTPKTQPTKKTWDEVWGPSFGITPGESSAGQVQVQDGASENVTPLSSWFFSKGPANFKRRVLMPKDTRPSKIARFGGSSPRARVSTSLRLPTTSTAVAASSGKGVDTRQCQSSPTGTKNEDQPSSFDRFLQDLTVTSAWRSWFGNVDPDSLLDPPLPSSVVSKLEPVIDLLSTPARSEPVTPSVDETEATVDKRTHKRHRMLDELEDAIREEKKRARAFEQDLLSMLQGKTLSGKDLDECVAMIRDKQSTAPSQE